MKSFKERAGEMTSDQEANGADRNENTSSNKESAGGCLGPDGDIAEPLMPEGAAKINEDEREHDGTKAQETCWNCKYNWRAFLPLNCCCKSPELTSFENSGFLEIATASWSSDVIKKGFKRTLQSSDLERLPSSTTAAVSYKRFMRIYNEEKAAKGEENVSLGKVYWRMVRTKYISCIICLLVNLSLEFTSAALVLRSLLEFVERPGGSAWDGLKWVILLTFFVVSRTLLVSTVFHTMLRTGIEARAATLSLIYNKLSKLKSVGSKSVGELVNLCANDAQRVFECCQFGVFLFGAPYLIILMSVYLYLKFGPSSLIGIAVMILFLPIQASSSGRNKIDPSKQRELQAFLGKLIGNARAKVIKITDKRVKMITEVITCIKLIKMYAWEMSFSKVISELRSKEKKLLAGMLLMQAVNMSMALLLTSIAPVATFAAHIAFGNDLTVAEAFTIIVMFNIFPPNISLLPVAVRGLSESLNAMKRLKNLLNLEEYVPHETEPDDFNVALSIQDADFAWVVPEDEKESKKNKPKKADDGEPTARINGMSNGNGSAEEKEPTVEFKDSGSRKNERPAKGAKGAKGLAPIELSLSPTLFSINLNIKRGSLIGICGGVGSGKSSLIQAILAQMHCSTGKVQVIKSTAYVSQQAWIVNDTIRNNITFGARYKEKIYKGCCDACSLNADIDSIESGDLTEIGERGINLSGGQKQRISLARALYADAELYLLDDPLSAVDAHVGKHIFENYIKKQLHGKTCIFVTHQLQYLKDCDEVIFMSDGSIIEHGTFSKLIDADKEFAQLIRKYDDERENSKQDKIHGDDAVINKLKRGLSHTSGRSDSSPSVLRRRLDSHASSFASETNISCGTEADDDNDEDLSEGEEKRIARGKIITKEESAEGSVTWKVYGTFMKAAGGYIISAFAVLMQVAVLATLSFVEWWLSNWLKTAKQPITIGNSTKVVSLAEHPDTNYFITIYVASGCSMFLIQTVASTIYVILFIKASTSLHNSVLKSILKCPMKFFDTTPAGRILNRFSRDLDELDGRLPWVTERLIRSGSRILYALIFIAVTFPWLLIAIIPLAFVFVFLNMLFRRTSRELKRIDNTTRSPIFSHLTATVQGLATLHAFNKTESFAKQFDEFVDKNSSPLFMFFISGRWFSVRLDVLCIVISITTALVAVVTKGVVPAAIAGLAIMYSLRVTGLFQFTCRCAAEAEARFTSVERMSHYATGIEHEGPFENETPPSKEWPSSGKVEFVNVQLRYRPGLPLVLKNVSFSVKGKEKVGIAGRTGAGKSSLAVSLFRLTELDGGKILIDGEDVSKIGLTDLRSKISVIPQDPVLFIGTLRYNLDPFGKYSDEELWLALEKAHVKDTVANLPLQLETLVIENGENFSVGERQLICMARALLQQSKILLLDEATAAIDSQTDAKIQITIRESFQDCTVLTIAHRLNTIMECDRILVMDDGKVAEFDTPSNLIARKDSIFAQMVKTFNASK